MKKLVFFLIIAFCSTHCMADKLDENDNEDENHRNIFQPHFCPPITGEPKGVITDFHG